MMKLACMDAHAARQQRVKVAIEAEKQMGLAAQQLFKLICTICMEMSDLHHMHGDRTCGC